MKAFTDKDDLRGLEENFVDKFIAAYFKSDPKARDKVDKKDKKALLALKKHVRSNLRDAYGMFLRDKRKKIEQAASTKDYEKLLQMHQSTQERFPYYKRFYAEVFAITKKPSSVLDIGCGFNPFSMQYMECKPLYNATDLNVHDMDLIRTYLAQENALGLVWVSDATTPQSYPKVDVCFILKVLDVLEHQERYVTEKFLESIPAKWLVISFATRSLGGGKKIPDSKRAWFEKLLAKKKWKAKEVILPNEKIYIIKTGRKV